MGLIGSSLVIFYLFSVYFLESLGSFDRYTVFFIDIKKKKGDEVSLFLFVMDVTFVGFTRIIPFQQEILG